MERFDHDKTNTLDREEFADFMNLMLDPSSSLGEAQKDLYTRKFKQLDSKNSGYISIEQSKKAVTEISEEQLRTWQAQKGKAATKPPKIRTDGELDELIKLVDLSGDGTINLAEFLTLMGHEMKEYNERQFRAVQWCPYAFEGINMDFVPWGKKTSVWTAQDVTSLGSTGLGGIPLLSDGVHVSIEVPKLRWVMTDQNLGIFNSLNTYIAEAFVFYILISQLRVLDREIGWQWLVGCKEGTIASESSLSPFQLCLTAGGD